MKFSTYIRQGLQRNLSLLFLLGWVFIASPLRAEEGPIAEVTAATSLMVAPGILAGGQVAVAQTQANAAVAMAGINSGAAIANATLQAQTAMANSQMMMQTSMLNQQAQTRDLLLQTQALAYNRAIDTELARQRMYEQVQLQQSLLAIEFKKSELMRLMAESNQLAGISIPSASSSGGGDSQSGASYRNPLSASLGSNLLSSAGKDSSGVTSSLGLKRVLGSSLGSGSTRRQVQSDLSVFYESTRQPSRNSSTSSGAVMGIYEASGSRHNRSVASGMVHH